MREERLQAIVEILEKQDFATVEELSQMLNTSMPTIRRDLNTLANRKSLIRSRGGAMRLSASQSSIPLSYKRVSHLSVKLAIAKEASALVQDNSVIFIDSSSTANCIINYLRNLNNVIIVTNSLEAATTLNNINANVYCLGGNIIGNSSSMGGYLALECAKLFHIDTFFFSSYGIDPQGYIVDSSDGEIDLKDYLLKHSGTNVFLCDQSKFDKVAPFRLAPLSQVDYFITNGPIPPHYSSLKTKIIITDQEKKQLL